MAKKKNVKKYKSTQALAGTLAPTGVSLTRSGNRINASWNIRDENYDGGQRVMWYIDGNCVYDSNIDTRETSSHLDFNPDSSFRKITIAVAGCKGTYTTQSSKTKTTKKKKTTTVTTNYFSFAWSAWSYADYIFSVPNAPEVSYELSNNGYNEGTFTWTVDADDSSGNHFRKYQWETLLVDKHNSETPPSNWGNAERGEGYTKTASFIKREAAELTNPDISFTRWFRVRSVGPAGASEWKYSYHVYALAKEAENVEATITRRQGNSGYTCSVSWDAPNSFMFPCDQAAVYYAMEAPATETSIQGETMVTDWAYPGTESLSWTEANTIVDTNGRDSLTFTIPRLLSRDDCLWIRVDTKHDTHVTYGIPVLAVGDELAPASPELQSINVNASTKRVTLEVKNNSEIEASFVAVHFRTLSEQDRYKTIGIIKKTESEQPVTIQLPDWGSDIVSFGLQTFVADYAPASRPALGTVADYKITNIKMKSGIVWEEGAVPIPPKEVVLTAPNTSAITVLWDWSWPEADQAELSWSKDPDAWESTNQPSTFVISDLYNPKWNITGLEVGTWWVRVRLGRRVTGTDNISWSVYSDAKQVKLSSAPAIPALLLSQGAATQDDVISCYWSYVSTDGTAQAHAEICEAVYDSSLNKYEYGVPFAKTNFEQHISFAVADRGWEVGTTHYLAVRVVSASGETSAGWSAPVGVSVVTPITAEIEDTSLRELAFEGEGYTLTADTEIVSGKDYYEKTGEDVYTLVADPVAEDLPEYYEVPTRNILALTEMPFMVLVDGAGLGSRTSVIIERAADFRMSRPDESDIDGYEGETIFSKTYDNDGRFTITNDELIGHLDDRAQYRLVVIAKDSYGQTAETSLEFEVHWAHQAMVPIGSATIDSDHNIAVLMATLPPGAVLHEGDVCDIYRLSVDKPQLIIEGAEFGERYVDEYPALGIHGGYRFVYRTVNGDYTTESNNIAWYNTTEHDNELIDGDAVIINFDGNQAALPYDISFSNTWKKDFIVTEYLGGHVQGDWNAAVKRESNISAVALDGERLDDDTIMMLRRLAEYPGVCHVRTPEGSSYAANIDVTEDRDTGSIRQFAKYTFDVTRVDSPGLDGITYDEWLEKLEEEEEG